MRRRCAPNATPYWPGSRARRYPTHRLSRTALAVWFRTSHPLLPKTMPNLVIEDDDMDNVIAYILSLRGRRAQ